MRPDLVIPGDAARPGMADGRDERQRAHEVGRLERQCEARDAPERVADDNRLSDSEALRRAQNRPGLKDGRRALAAAGPGTPAMARAIDAEHPKAGLAQPVGERNAEIRRIAGGAVNHQDRAPRLATLRPVKSMDGAAADIDPGPGRGITRLDPARLDGGEDPERGDNGESESQDRHCASERRAARLTIPRPRLRP